MRQEFNDLGVGLWRQWSVLEVAEPILSGGETKTTSPSEEITVPDTLNFSSPFSLLLLKESFSPAPRLEASLNGVSLKHFGCDFQMIFSKFPFPPFLTSSECLLI